MQTFTQTQIETLRSEAAKIQTVDPTGNAYAKIRSFLNKLNQDQLKMLADADIKWFSSLALNRIVMH